MSDPMEVCGWYTLGLLVVLYLLWLPKLETQVGVGEPFEAAGAPPAADAPKFTGEVPKALFLVNDQGDLVMTPGQTVVSAVEAKVGASIAKMATLSGDKAATLQARVASTKTKQTAAVEAHESAVATKAKTVAKLLLTVRDGYVQVGEQVGVEVKNECTEDTYMLTGDDLDYGENRTEHVQANGGCGQAYVGWKFANTMMQRSQLRSWVIHPRCNSCNAKETDVSNMPYVDRSVLKEYGDGDACAALVPTRLDALAKA